MSASGRHLTLHTSLSYLGFYARVGVLCVAKPFFILCGYLSTSLRDRIEFLVLRMANRLFRIALDVSNFVSLEKFYASQDPSDFFTLCRKVGIHDDWFAGKRLLDVGCGVGVFSVAVARQGAAFVQGIDIDAERCRFASRMADTIGITQVGFAGMSVEALSFEDNTFDGAFSHTVFEHLPNVAAALKEIHRVLRPGAELVITYDSYRSRYGAHLATFIRVPWPYLFFSESTLTRYWHRRREALQRAYHLDTPPQLLDIRDALGGLNRLPIAQVHAIVADSPFEVVTYAAYGDERFLLTLIPFLQRIPWLYEYLRGSCVFRLRKPSASPNG